MCDTKQKYIRLKQYDEIIIFHSIIEHDAFKDLNPISAGFCYVGENKISCFGKSISLKLNSMDDNSNIATKQIFGLDAMFELIKQ